MYVSNFQYIIWFAYIVFRGTLVNLKAAFSVNLCLLKLFLMSQVPKYIYISMMIDCIDPFKSYSRGAN